MAFFSVTNLKDNNIVIANSDNIECIWIQHNRLTRGKEDEVTVVFYTTHDGRPGISFWTYKEALRFKRELLDWLRKGAMEPFDFIEERV